MIFFLRATEIKNSITHYVNNIIVLKDRTKDFDGYDG